MNVVFTIGLRNLVRQKRRSFLLGIAIAIGTAILILAHGFSHGISDNLFNRIVVYVSGHVGVVFSENGNLFRQVFHDGPHIKEIVKKEIPDIIKIEEGLGVFCRAIGNRKSDNVIMVGVDLTQTGDEKTQQQDADNFKMIDGRFEDLESSSIENPVLLSKEKAAYLNVKKGDILRVRYRTINGQDQAARLTVTGIFIPANMFMSAPIFLELGDLKKLLGYGENDIGQLFITIKNPKENATKYAERLQEVLQPTVARIAGFLSKEDTDLPVTVLGFKSDSTSRALLNKKLTTITGINIGKSDAVMSESLAVTLGVKPGDFCTVKYNSKYEGEYTARLKITTLIKNNSVIPSDVILVNDEEFYKSYYARWPEPTGDDQRWFMPVKNHTLYGILSPEWILMPRARSTEELTKLQREIGQKQYKGTTVDVRTMYESASAVLSLEYALNLITLIAVLILFFIILIGVVNTLRMTVKERTREIGTIRAIGMQKKDVQLSFMLETFFLTLFSSAAGTGLAFAAMQGLSMIKIDASGNPLGMLLVNERLYFVPTAVSVSMYILLILAIAVVTAYFPARKAANLSAADALRHFE